MPIIDFNVGWMTYNSFLAFVPVILGYLLFRVKGKYLKAAIALLWFIFLPNTIYIFTDLEHLVKQWQEIHPTLRPLLLLEYAIFEIIGVITFLLAFFPFEKFVQRKKFFKKNRTTSLIIFNFFIAFGMVLGRVERINSWDIFTQPQIVLNSSFEVFRSIDLIGLTVLFGLVCNFVYFLFRHQTVVLIKKYLH